MSSKVVRAAKARSQARWEFENSPTDKNLEKYIEAQERWTDAMREAINKRERKASHG